MMVTRILLLNPPMRRVEGEVRHASPPLGLAYIAASLEASGRPVTIVDAVTLGYDTEYDYGDGVTGLGATPDMVLEHIRVFAPDVVGISCIFTFSAGIGCAFARRIRAEFPQMRIVFGGTHATVTAAELIKADFCDFVIRGEGEIAMVRLAEALEGLLPLDDVPGLTRCEGGAVIETEQQFIEDLDSLPHPARHLLDMECYTRIGRMQGGAFRRGVRVTTLITSRGCPAKCVFCAIHSVWGRSFRGHSPAYVLAELQELRTRWGIDHVLFEDDNLTYDPVRAETIFRGMIDSGLGISWDTPNGVALWRLTGPLLRLMKQAGCNRLSVAIESGDPHTLTRIIRKPLRLDRAVELVAVCRDIGLRTTAFFVVGFPGETVEAIRRSLDFAERVRTDTVAIMIATPYPGTPLYQHCIDNGLLVEGFDPGQLYTRVGQIRTPDFTPALLARLIARTQRRRALRFPLATLRRLWEKFVSDPGAFIAFLRRQILPPARDAAPPTTPPAP